jgi:hypothetical protein
MPEVNGEAFTRYLPTETANRHIRDALRKSNTTKEVKVAGVRNHKDGIRHSLQGPAIDGNSGEQHRVAGSGL